MSKTSLRALALLASLLLCSCVTFESGDLPGLDRWPPPAGGGGWLHVTVDGLPKKFEDGWQRGIVRELEGAGRARGVELMLRVTSPFAPADVSVAFDFEHARQDLWTTRIWMAVCAMTASVVPARTEQCFDVRATFCDRDGRQLGVIERSVSGATWVGVLTLLLTPFEGAGLGQLVQDTTRSIVVEAVEKGWL